MFQIDDLKDLPLAGDILREIAAQHPDIDPSRRVHELVRRLITRMIEDVIVETKRRAAEIAPASSDAVREAGRPLVGFSAAMAEADRAIKGFLYPKVYRSDRIMRIMTDAERVVRDLFGYYATHYRELPDEWLAGLDPADEASRARRIGDFIAGMTDRYAMIEHARLVGKTPELR
jgi:dGTPase